MTQTAGLTPQQTKEREKEEKKDKRTKVGRQVEEKEEKREEERVEVACSPGETDGKRLSFFFCHCSQHGRKDKTRRIFFLLLRRTPSLSSFPSLSLRSPPLLLPQHVRSSGRRQEESRTRRMEKTLLERQKKKREKTASF